MSILNKIDNGCFAAGTLVHTDKGLVPIQDIKVGDMVLSKPEDGSGEVSYKPVLNTFVHENKELWMVHSIKEGSFTQINAKKSSDKIRIVDSASGYADFLATPNHPIWVVGRGLKKDEDNVVLDEIIMYPEPHWKRVDQLERYEVMVNADGVMYYIERAQPVYQFDTNINIPLKPSYMWYQEEYYAKEYDKYGNVIKYDADGNWIEPDDYGNPDEYEEISPEELERRRNRGWVLDSEYYEKKGIIPAPIDGILTVQNQLKDIQGNYLPFLTTVYNLEVADNHTYFIDTAGVWVHNMNCTTQA